MAAVEGIKELATLLLCLGAEPTLVDDEDETARDVAQRMGNDELAIMLARVVSQHQASALSRMTLLVPRTLAEDESSSKKRRL